MIKKIENIYLSILGVIVMVIVSLLLIFSIILRLNGIKIFLKEPQKLNPPTILLIKL